MSVNKVILVGRLGKDPELRRAKDQSNAICSFSLATSERRKDATGNWGDHTEWHNIVTFGATAENCEKFLRKGRLVYIEGKIQTRKWQDKEGHDRYTTEIIASTVQFLERKEAAGGDVAIEQYPEASAAASAAVFNSLKSADAMKTSDPTDLTFDDDDIPF